jgi:endo-1,4-beta-D-glucanase Y
MNNLPLLNFGMVALALAGAACSSSPEPQGAGSSTVGNNSGGSAGASGSDGSGGSGGDTAGSGGSVSGTGGGANGGSGGSGEGDAGSSGGAAGSSAMGTLFGAHPLTYPTGSIHPTGDQATLDTAVAAAYDNWKKAYVKEGCGGMLVATQDGEPGEMTGSIALGRGMVLTAIMAGHDPDAQKLFDGFYTVGRAKPSAYKGNEALVAYSVGANCSTNGDSGSIFSGDADFAYGLLLADKQWGSAGTINYAEEAKKTIAAMKKFDMNPTLSLPLDGDWAALPGEDAKGWFTDTQTVNFIFGHFRVFAKAGGDAFWTDTVTKLQGLIDTTQTMYSPNSGFLPAYFDESKPAKSGYAIAFDDKVHAGDFAGGAAAGVLRLAADYAASGDAKTKAEFTKVLDGVKKATGGDPTKIVDGYLLAGTAFGTKGTASFIAPMGAAAMFDAGNQAWLDGVWKLMVAAPAADSETDSTNLLGMLLVTGNWWSP